ncbi:magnesium/cobalt transporter CorA [Pseudomonadota bacterium]
MIRAALIDRISGEIVLQEEAFLKNWVKSESQIIWVDFESVDPEKEKTILEKTFGIERLAVEDAQRDRHPPKLEWFDNCFFLLVKAFNASTDSPDFGILHISLFVGNDFLLTRHAGVSPSINTIWDAMLAGKLQVNTNPQHICYRIVRTIIDRYTPVILNMEKRLEDLENLMIEDPSDTLLAELINYNGTLKKLRRIFGYQQSMLSALARNETIAKDKDRVHEYQDIYEQMERLASLCGLLQELTRDLIDGYISVSSHRLNQIMKVLTIAAVIFLPLTFLAGIYGMNFENIPELKIESAYYVLLAVMVTMAAALVAIFRKLKWL